MKIYKEKQFLVFDFEDGKTVKYDFATKTCIGKKGKPVTNLCSQLSGLTIDQLCDFCTDKQYGKFLRYVKNNGDYYSRGISNIGTILSRVPHFANLEQIFSAGIEDIVDDRNFNYTINDIPKGIIKLCKNHNIKLSNKFLEFYKQNPDAYILSYNLEYTLSRKRCVEITARLCVPSPIFPDSSYAVTWNVIIFPSTAVTSASARTSSPTGVADR